MTCSLPEILLITSNTHKLQLHSFHYGKLHRTYAPLFPCKVRKRNQEKQRFILAANVKRNLAFRMVEDFSLIVTIGMLHLFAKKHTGVLKSNCLCVNLPCYLHLLEAKDL